MRTILMVGDSVYPDTMGGSHRSIYEQSKRLVEHGHRVIVFSPQNSNESKEKEIIDGIEIYRYPRNRESKIKGMLDYVIQPYKLYKKLFKNQEINVFHGHWALTDFLMLKKLYHDKKIKKLYTFHGPVAEEYGYELKCNKIIKAVFLKIVRLCEKKCLQYSDQIIAQSGYMRRKEIQLYGNDDKTKVCYPRIDMNSFSLKYSKEDAKKKLGLEKGIRYIFCVRRIKRRMGLDNLVKAFSIVCKEYPDTRLLIGGKGDYLDELKGIAKECKVEDKVQFLGFIKDEELSVYYQAATFAVTPSVELEGFGLVTCEAMACGTPVIATNVCANPEIIDPVIPELLSEGFGAEALAKTMKWALDNESVINKIDYRKYVYDHFSWDINFEEIENYYL